jgi:hypothetical protein
MEIVLAHKAEILGILWLVSEVLAAIPAVKANSVFQIVKGILAKVLGK